MFNVFPCLLNRILMTTRGMFLANQNAVRGFQNLEPEASAELCYGSMLPHERAGRDSSSSFSNILSWNTPNQQPEPSLCSRVLKMKRNSFMERKRSDPNLRLWPFRWPRRDLWGLRFIISVKNTRLTASRNPKHMPCLLVCRPLLLAQQKSLRRNAIRWEPSWEPSALILAWLTSVKWLPD